jgi:hypothetical protein
VPACIQGGSLRLEFGRGNTDVGIGRGQGVEQSSGELKETVIIPGQYVRANERPACE